MSSDSVEVGFHATFPIEIAEDDRLGQRRARSRAAFAEGEVIAAFEVIAARDRPDRLTVQISEREHAQIGPPPLRFINHSCAPNARFDVEARRLVAVRPIAAGDEITYFYPSTEWAMDAPFACQCGSPRCLGTIAGAGQIAEGVLRAYHLAPHVLRLLARR